MILKCLSENIFLKLFRRVTENAKYQTIVGHFPFFRRLFSTQYLLMPLLFYRKSNIIFWHNSKENDAYKINAQYDIYVYIKMISTDRISILFN